MGGSATAVVATTKAAAIKTIMIMMAANAPGCHQLTHRHFRASGPRGSRPPLPVLPLPATRNVLPTAPAGMSTRTAAQEMNLNGGST